MKSIKTLESLENLRKNVILAPYTTWKIGGAARYFWEPDYKLLPQVIYYCYKNGIPYYFLGRGSNVLIDDEGLDGLVICTSKSLQDITFKDGFIEAQSGVPLPTLAKFAAKYGFGGYEFLIGIPGTVGGGIVMNAGLTAKQKREISDIIVEAEVLLPDGTLEWRKKEDLGLTYRNSNLIDKGIFITKARFKQTWISTEEEIRHITAEHLADRRRKQPLGKATAGSTFKQPEGGKPAGWYIDKAGLKGYQLGGAKISEIHANWIENDNNASSDDIKQIMNIVKEKVYEIFYVKLEKEVGMIENYRG